MIEPRMQTGHVGTMFAILSWFAMNSGQATFRQNLSHHPEDWYCIRFRPVFWLAFILRRRLPMQCSAQWHLAGFVRLTAAGGCTGMFTEAIGRTTGFPFHLLPEQGARNLKPSL